MHRIDNSLITLNSKAAALSAAISVGIVAGVPASEPHTLV